MPNVSLTCSLILASHKVVEHFNIPIFAASDDELVVWRYYEVCWSEFSYTELFSHGFDFSDQWVDPEVLKFPCCCHDKQVTTIWSEHDFTDSLASQINVPSQSKVACLPDSNDIRVGTNISQIAAIWTERQ